MSRPNTPSYKTLNWPAYNKALKRRGSLTVWFDPDMTWAAQPTGKRGRQPVYSDAAIQTCLTPAYSPNARFQSARERVGDGFDLFRGFGTASSDGSGVTPAADG